MMNNQIRIIGGKWRGRKIPVLDVPGLRPTPDRVRETLFNWLMYDIQEARCLDCFAGTGALGFEALSRGASEVVMVEMQASVCEALRFTAQQFNTTHCEILLADIFQVTPASPAPFDIIFCDPPFKQELLIKLLNYCLQKKFIAPHTLIYFEAEKTLALALLAPRFELLKHKIAGQVQYGLLKLK